MLRAFRPPTVPATDFKPGTNVRWAAGRFLKQRGGEVDSSSVDSGLRDRVRSRSASEHGFTLIEVLVAALITLIISAGVATALVSATDYTSLARGQTNAQAVAEQDQERLKSMSDAQLTSLHQTRTVTLGGSQWTVTSTATFLSATGQSSCTSLSTAYFKIASTVTDSTASGSAATLANVETIITRPLAGSLVAPVDDQIPTTPLSGSGSPRSGRPPTTPNRPPRMPTGVWRSPDCRPTPTRSPPPTPATSIRTATRPRVSRRA